MSLKQFSTSSPALPGSSFPASKNRQPVTAPVLIHRSDTLALGQGDWGTRQENLPPGADWLGMSGYSLMLMGGVGCLYKWFIA